MKTIVFFACVTAGSLLAHGASAAGSKTLWPVAADKAICDPIFSRLDSLERGTLVAQAETEAEKPQQSGGDENKADAPNEEELTTQLSAMLQACSYDGKAFEVDPRTLDATADPQGAAAIGTIMRFTGLPQNFTVMESDVPNAAAIIVQGADGIPKRVIAYNRDFLKQVVSATDGSNWSSLSIMAHEIGHHLSGHTLVPGGSQPPIELEADKFSGFVLFKMGAKRADAEKAIATLIPEEDGPTHPGRKKRLDAVGAGWTESCLQQQDDCTGGETVVATVAEEPKAPSPMPEAMPDTTDGAMAMPDIPGAADIAMPDLSRTAAGETPATPSIDRMPQLDAATTPSKFDRFIYDEVGVFDPAVRDKLQRIAFQFAAAANVEIVTIVAKDLQGRSADQYALDALRQLRVGKLDVGNGAVLVVSPATNETGVALGPGLLVQYDSIEPLRIYLKGFLDVVAGGGKPQSASGLIADASYRIMRDTKALEWAVRFGSLDQMQTTAAKAQADLKATGTPYDPNKDPTWRKLLRIDARVVSTAPDMSDARLGINEPKTRFVGPALHVRTAEGKDAVLYVNPNVTALMPVPLEAGKTYAFIARDSFLAGGAPQFDLISYDLVD